MGPGTPREVCSSHENISGAWSDELGLAHVGAVAEAVGEEKDASVAPRCEVDRSKLIDADKDFDAVG